MKPAPLSKFALAQTRARLKRVTTELGRAAGHPHDPETAHDLRVAIRRFTHCLRTFRGLLDPETARPVRKRLRELMELCGAKRDYDVGLEVLGEAGLAQDSPAVAQFRENRDHGVRELRRYLRKKGQRGVASHGKNRLRRRKKIRLTGDPRGEWEWSASVADNVQRMLPRLAGEFFHQGGAAMAIRGDYDILHQFRLGTKRFRYTLEVFRPFYQAAFAAKLLALGRLQDRMGAVNDCVVVLKLPGMDRAAKAAVGKLLATRYATLRQHWRKTFSPRSRAAWDRVLAHPKRER